MGIVRLLIVDDNKDFSVLLSAFFSTISGFQIVGIAADGSNAIRMINETNPDVVLLDIVMPGVDGLEVLRYIRNAGITSPFVLVLSAIGAKEIYSQAQALGANAFFQKPVRMETIARAIRDVFEKTPSLEEEVTKLLTNMKIPPHILGYRYLRDLLVFYLNNCTMNITPLAHTVANSCGVKYDIFLSNIRYVIGLAWDQDYGKNTESIFYNHKTQHLKKPTIHQFLRLVAYKLK